MSTTARIVARSEAGRSQPTLLGRVVLQQVLGHVGHGNVRQRHEMPPLVPAFIVIVIIVIIIIVFVVVIVIATTISLACVPALTTTLRALFSHHRRHHLVAHLLLVLLLVGTSPTPPPPCAAAQLLNEALRCALCSSSSPLLCSAPLLFLRTPFSASPFLFTLYQVRSHVIRRIECSLHCGCSRLD